MNSYDYLQVALYIAALIIPAPFLGRYMARVFSGERTWLHPVLAPVENITYRLSGVKADREMNWKEYAFALMVFNLMGLIVVTALQLWQSHLPLNTQKLPDVPLLLALNTAVSFITNTNWQAYSGESTLSYFSQMLGLGVQNFVSAATGFAALLALIRGLVGRGAQTLGNFWIDLTRATLYVLLPLSILFAVLFTSQGVVQTFNSYADATTLEVQKDAVQTQQIPLGPAASQIAIKQLGTNGGGFFGVNSAHPFENPTPFSNFLEMLALLLLPIACVAMFGEMARKKKHAYAILTAMFVLFFVGLATALYFEHQPNPVMDGLKNFEGKELRFGITNSALWATATTAVSNGAVNSMHDSLQPITGMIATFNMMLGEIIFGGVGSGLYGILAHVIVTVFLAGLMVGRTPEYLGKKIEAREVKLAMLAIIVPSVLILVFTAIAVVTEMGLSSLNNKGPHGFSEILYAFVSASGNNGSAFAGLNGNTNFYNAAIATCMFVARFAVIIPMLAIAGGMAVKKITPPSTGTFRTDTTVFIVLLVGEIVIVGGLTFFPALVLGPLAEHFLLPSAKLF
ncbi:MAG: Potassium-transporting ATPase potassium-binding subunit [Turneriella sp.]|nr:Potassium-transporting ATPase potassium-binding subunit [Turneriella sp.]